MPTSIFLNDDDDDGNGAVAAISHTYFSVNINKSHDCLQVRVTNNGNAGYFELTVEN